MATARVGKQTCLDLEEAENVHQHIHTLPMSRMKLKPQTPLNKSIAPEVCLTKIFWAGKEKWLLQRSWNELLKETLTSMFTVQYTGGGGPLALVCCSVFLSSASADGFMVADIWEPFTVPRLWPQEWCELFWQFDPRLLHCFMIWVTSPVTRGATSAASSKRHWLPWVEQQYILGTVKQRNASEVTLQLFPSL